MTSESRPSRTASAATATRPTVNGTDGMETLARVGNPGPDPDAVRTLTTRTPSR